MKRFIAIIALVLIGTGFMVLSGALGGDYITWGSRAYSYVCPGGQLAGLRDTSDFFTLPENVKNVTFWIECDSGAANADTDSLFYVLYGVTPYGAYVYLDTIAKAAYADNAVESTGCRITKEDTFWHYHTIVYDSAAANPKPIRVQGQGWLDQFTHFAMFVRATDTSDLGTSIRWTYTTYPTSGFTPY